MICAIVLAAGQSRRMGGQKLLLPLAGGTVISHIVGQLLASPVDQTIVVAGRDAAGVADALSGLKVMLVINPEPEGDMLSSVRCGLRVLPEKCQAVLVALGDQPSITAGLIGGMIAAFCAGGRGIVVPVYGGKSGHPVLFSRRYCPEILSQYDQVGLGGLLAAHAGDLLELPVADSSVLEDMDYPEDYRRELSRLAGR